METLIGFKNDWKGVNTLEQAVQLIDYGVVLKWRDMRSLKKAFSTEQQAELIKHFVVRLCERADNRLSAEITVESILIWLANGGSEVLVHTFLDTLLEQSGCEEACRALVEISLTSEVVENTHDEDIFAMAVALICELGLALRRYETTYPGELEDIAGILDHITTYLISVANSNNACIRLSLLHYFGRTSREPGNRDSFNRVISRFGHTVLDHLFGLLFRKRSEAVALQYLLENMPYVLNANHHAQRIVHETMKYYMLKQPERFGLFMQILTDSILESENVTSIRVLLQHLGALLKVSANVHHKALARDLCVTIMKFDLPSRIALAEEVTRDGSVREPIKSLIEHLRDASASEKVADSIAQFRSNKRGRKPSFSRVELPPLNQISYLGGMDIAKAS